jgi:hypothetical protein
MTPRRTLLRLLRSSSGILPAFVVAGCLATSPHLVPELPPPRPAPDDDRLDVAAGTASAVSLLARHLVAQAASHTVTALDRRTLDHRNLWANLETVIEGGSDMHRSRIGESVEGRPLYAIEFGSGPIRVLLWSQMHGDEPTATLALVDLLRFVVDNADDPLVTRIRQQIKVVVVPMLNPDGAQRGRRENAAGIDINRDARRQASPEARALAALHARLSPHFGFNLHDQRPRLAEDGRTVAISLLAPAAATIPGDMPIRTRAKQLAVIMRMAADSLVDGRVTRYDEAHNVHAFGDAMQSWGTSTVLIETGEWENDRDKSYLRQVNFALLLTALDAIATRSFEHARIQDYESLPGTRPVNNRQYH